ncbi:hypothetical protein ACQWHR_24990, partial [Salmonella enterica subsp. enterica serovar Infantis]
QRKRQTRNDCGAGQVVPRMSKNLAAIQSERLPSLTHPRTGTPQETKQQQRNERFPPNLNPVVIF